MVDVKVIVYLLLSLWLFLRLGDISHILGFEKLKF